MTCEILRGIRRLVQAWLGVAYPCSAATKSRCNVATSATKSRGGVSGVNAVTIFT